MGFGVVVYLVVCSRFLLVVGEARIAWFVCPAEAPHGSGALITSSTLEICDCG